MFSLASCSAFLERGELSILSGSENEALEPLFEEFSNRTGIRITMTYLGSVDIMMKLATEELEQDAVWPANSFWITLGDRQKRIKHARSIFTSPVVFGVRRDKAQQLGWVDRLVSIRDILQAIREGNEVHDDQRHPEQLWGQCLPGVPLGSSGQPRGHHLGGLGGAHPQA